VENGILKINAKDASMMAKEAALNAMREYYAKNQKILDVIADLIVEKANEGLHVIEFSTESNPEEGIQLKACSDWVLARSDDESKILLRLFETNGFNVNSSSYLKQNKTHKKTIISW